PPRPARGAAAGALVSVLRRARRAALPGPRPPRAQRGPVARAGLAAQCGRQLVVLADDSAVEPDGLARDVGAVRCAALGGALRGAAGGRAGGRGGAAGAGAAAGGAAPVAADGPARGGRPVIALPSCRPGA